LQRVAASCICWSAAFSPSHISPSQWLRRPSVKILFCTAIQLFSIILGDLIDVNRKYFHISPEHYDMTYLLKKPMTVSPSQSPIVTSIVMKFFCAFTGLCDGVPESTPLSRLAVARVWVCANRDSGGGGPTWLGRANRKVQALTWSSREAVKCGGPKTSAMSTTSNMSRFVACVDFEESSCRLKNTWDWADWSRAGKRKSRDREREKERANWKRDYSHTHYGIYVISLTNFWLMPADRWWLKIKHFIQQ